MGPLKRFFRKLKGRIFGFAPHRTDSSTGSPCDINRDSEKSLKILPTETDTPQRDPYFIQIGFDFGTAYSKCVCRDVFTDIAWVWLPSESSAELPFLISSGLVFNNGLLNHCKETSTYYFESGLYHLKLALQKVGLRVFDDPVLDPFRRAIRSDSREELSSFVRECGVYFLAGSLGCVRDSIRKRFHGFGAHKDDYMAVNLAIPVAHAERAAEVRKVYTEILGRAWRLSDELAGHPQIELQALAAKAKDIADATDDGPCFLYPEVCANVQGFVRSRASSPGIYLFSDTGAGTVDQSVFIFVRRDSREHLTFLDSSVLPLGSSHIERLAACRRREGIQWQNLESFRRMKEEGQDHPDLDTARDEIRESLNQGTSATLARARSKLPRPRQLEQTRLIFCGGGHRFDPYAKGVIESFSGPLFPTSFKANTIGLPTPKDLRVSEEEAPWMKRLSVAYGLSFPQAELTEFTPSGQVAKVHRKPRRQELTAVSKDEC